MINHNPSTIRHYCKHPGCGKGFYYKWRYNAHKALHAKISNFHCDVCDRPVSQRWNWIIWVYFSKMNKLIIELGFFTIAHDKVQPKEAWKMQRAFGAFGKGWQWRGTIEPIRSSVQQWQWQRRWWPARKSFGRTFRRSSCKQSFKPFKSDTTSAAKSSGARWTHVSPTGHIDDIQWASTSTRNGWLCFALYGTSHMKSLNPLTSIVC